jgi:hypothetical protein
MKCRDKVGHRNCLRADNYFSPPLGTINAAPRFGVRSRPFDGRSRCRAKSRIPGCSFQLDRDLAALHPRKDDDARESLTRVSVRFAEDW